MCRASENVGQEARGHEPNVDHELQSVAVAILRSRKRQQADHINERRRWVHIHTEATEDAAEG